MTNPNSGFLFVQVAPLTAIQQACVGDAWKGWSEQSETTEKRADVLAQALPHAGCPGFPGLRAMADSGSSSPWWKSLTRKKSKEVTVGAQPQVQVRPETGQDPSPPSSDRTSSSQENQHSNVLGDTGEPLRSDKLYEEKSGNSRRNLKISRSGRFKEKRKMRATLLPEGDRSPEEADFPDDSQEDKE